MYVQLGQNTINGEQHLHSRDLVLGNSIATATNYF